MENGYNIGKMAKKLTTKQVGNLGEDIAVRFLMKRGYLITDRNYWKKWGEIDIIAQKNGMLHFVEVKTVSRENILNVLEKNGYRPEENVHPRKLQRMFRTIESYCIERAVDQEWQIDVIAVYLDVTNQKARVSFLENIVLS